MCLLTLLIEKCSYMAKFVKVLRALIHDHYDANFLGVGSDRNGLIRLPG